MLQIPTDYIPHFDVTHICDSQGAIIFFIKQSIGDLQQNQLLDISVREE